MSFSREEKREYAKRMEAYDIAAAMLRNGEDDEALEVLRDLVDGKYPNEEWEDDE